MDRMTQIKETYLHKSGECHNIEHRFTALGKKYEKPRTEAPRLDSTADSAERERLTFFYHPDHLGSTNFVTDIDGNAVQFVSYIPYGEVFVEERNSSFSSSYLFNAKELDNETGLYYYGARYLDPQNASWLSVDPLFEKYPGISPYSYCVGNPVRLVDVDGRRIEIKNEDGENVCSYVPGKSEPHYSEYVNDAISALNYLYETGDKEIQNTINTLVKADVSYVINYTGINQTAYNVDMPVLEGESLDVHISWDNRSGLKTDVNAMLSPTVCLYHELGHAMECLSAYRNQDNDYFFNRAYDVTDNFHEYVVIREYETRAAIALNEFVPKKGMPYTRKFYNGKGEGNLRYSSIRSR